MARRPRLFAPGLLYHVIVRGNQRLKTFLDDRDYQVYLERLAKYRKLYGYNIHAYCLMPNHVHLLVESSDHPLGKFMQGLQQSYSQYFNARHRKVGHVFQGRYKAIICDRDEYLLELTRYIHLNPVRAEMVKTPDHYHYSGHRAYIEGKADTVIDPASVLKLFGGKAAYRRFVQDGLEDGHKDQYYEVEDQRFLGGEGFGEKLTEDSETRPAVTRRKPLESIVRELAKHFQTTVEVIRSSDRSWEISKARTTIAFVLTRRLGYRLADVAAYINRDVATVGTLLARMNTGMSGDQKLQQEIARLVKNVES